MTKRVKQVKNQALLWIPPGEDLGAFVKTVPPIPFDGQHPDRVWTLYRHTHQDAPPALPFYPIHHKNAFLEDEVHDWTIDRKKRFHYASRVTEGGCWVLLEYLSG